MGPPPPTIAALLIVRDEQEHLGACLDSLAGLVGDIVVVDTGSTDATPEIARSRGADLHRMAWPDDFAAARNAGLERVAASWVLSIDADETVTGHDLDGVRRVTADPLAVAGLVSLRPAPGTTAYRELRLFRNRADLRFAGSIHESVEPAVTRLTAAGELTAVPVPIHLEHAAPADPRVKAARDLPLLLRRLAAEPDHVRCWRELGVAHAVLGDLDRAVDAWQRAIELVRAASRPAGGDVLAYLDVIASTLDHERPGIDADALLAEAISAFGPVPALRLLRVDLRWRAGDVAAVLQDLVALGEVDPLVARPAVAVPADALGAGAWDRAGALRLAIDDTEGAAEAYRRSFELDPSPARRARLAVARGRADRVAGARA